jgi:carbonic anhydrase
MEAHFVHAAAGGLAVVGVFIVPGKKNAVFNKIVSTMPQEAGPPVSADPSIDPGRLLPAERGYYHYEGSLTTPPCSQSVDWILLARHLEVASRYFPLRNALPDECPSSTKNRPAVHSQVGSRLTTRDAPSAHH